MKQLLSLLTILCLHVVTAKADDLTVLNIDGIGPDALKKVKQTAQVDWWLEMGDDLIVSTNDKSTQWPTGVSVKTTLSDVNTAQLAIHVLGHCDHSNTDAILHKNLNAIYTGDAVRLISTTNTRDINQLYAHASILPFEKNKVFSYQISNRSLNQNKQVNSEVQGVLNQVNQDRWFNQVAYLASLDRMLEADLIIAGEWLENKFQNLGLTTSRISLHSDYRGFNIVGFKQGTSRADDWYVVGAHLDSRNQNKNDLLPSPGAEDNASGCSGVLEIANVISIYETDASIVFMCFIEEENGLLGSQDVVTHLTNTGDINKVQTMLNMDMIGYRSTGNNTAIAGTNTASYHSLAQQVATNGQIYTDLDWQVSLQMCCTDFVSFTQAGIPAATSNEPDIWNYFAYHTVNDRAEYVDPTMGSDIVRANLATLINMVGVDFASGDLIFADSFEAL